MKNNVDIIFDIDGTLLNIQHRVHHLRKIPPDWKSFNESMEGDIPIPEMVELLVMLGNDKRNRLIFCSGRSVQSKTITEKQIINILTFIEDKRNLKKINLYLRSAGDFREDFEVKSDLYEQMCKDGFKPVLVFEDRASVVEMWQARGLRCLQVAEGNF